jgi:Fe-S cluster assembly protein SufD
MPLASIVRHYLAEYENTSALTANTQSTPILREKRKQAIEQFSQTGFPSVKEENWRYFVQASLLKQPFSIIPPPISVCATQTTHLPEPLSGASIRLVFVNGYFIPWLSPIIDLPQGLIISNLAESNEEKEAQVANAWVKSRSQLANGFTALNFAFSQDGILIETTPGAQIEPFIELLFLSDHTGYQHLPAALIPVNHFIQIGPDSHIRFIERYGLLGEQQIDKRPTTFSNVFTTLKLATNAKVDWYSIIHTATQDCHIAQLIAFQQAHSQLSCNTLHFGGGLSRQTIQVLLQGTAATCQLHGLSLSQQQQQIDQQISVLHQAPNTKSTAHYRAIATGESQIAFGGEVYVQPGASKIEAQQGSHNLLLSQQAEINTRPQLSIQTDDIVCTHGATIGQLNEAARFYLQARGLPRKAAEMLLMTAFTQVILKTMPLLETQAVLNTDLSTVLAAMSDASSHFNNSR